MKNNYLKNACIGLSAILLYFLLYNFKGLPFYIFNVNIYTVSVEMKVIYLIIYEILMMAIFALIFNKELTKDFKDMKKNHKKYYSENFKYYLIGFMLMIISNAIIIFLLNKGVALNETMVRQSFEISPIYMYFSAVIFAPFTEELIFRGCVKKIIPTKYLFILLSSLIFGYIHISDNYTGLSDLLYLIPYGALGASFAYVYSKTNNIFTNMGLHLMHNGILIALQFLMLIVG